MVRNDAQDGTLTPTWPALTNLPKAIRLAASSRSLSGSIITGFLPPSSRVVGVKYCAAAAATTCAVFPLPVNATGQEPHKWDEHGKNNGLTVIPFQLEKLQVIESISA